jgi:hypothetical protein
MTARLIRFMTALAALMVAGVAAAISYAYELVTTHGETGFTARLLPFTVDGLIWAGHQRSSRRYLRAAGHSQHAIARDLNLARRKVKQIIDRVAA